MATPPIGALSSGTMLLRDLIPTFMAVLDTYAPTKAADIRAEWAEFFASEDADKFDTDEAAYVHEQVWDALDEIAPDGAFFGTAEGDGACYGFWHI